jgi:hypothetical protein
VIFFRAIDMDVCLRLNAGNTEDYLQKKVTFIRTIDICLRLNAGNTEHDLQRTVIFIRTIDMVVRGLMLGTQNKKKLRNMAANI